MLCPQISVLGHVTGVLIINECYSVLCSYQPVQTQFYHHQGTTDNVATAEVNISVMLADRNSVIMINICTTNAIIIKLSTRTQNCLQ